MMNLISPLFYKKLCLGSFLPVLCSILAYGQENPHKAPLYWSVYESHIVKEQNGVQDNFIPESEWLANINWVDENLKDLGYDMICIDGWGDVSQFNEHGYRTSHSKHWEHDYAWWSMHLKERGMTLGMYGNPLWISREAADSGVKIKGTDIPVKDIADYNEETLWFTWVQVDRPGAEEYVKGYMDFYASMGIKYFRVDFLSWFEDGYDRNLGTVGPERDREHYETALRWMREACDKNGMYLSLVMPHMYQEAALESQYGHMTRINEDTGFGAWWKFSEKDRGHRYAGWSQYANAFDGFTYWSHIAGRNKIILDGDFIRINTFANDTEKKTVIATHLMAGGPITISDQYNTIGEDLWLYQNEELLALNRDGFVGKPLYTNDPNNELSQVWAGQMSNGDWIIGLFNREDHIRSRSVDFHELGINGEASVRDLWEHVDLGSMESIAADIPPHGCLILKVVQGNSNCEKQIITFDQLEDFELTEENTSLLLNATSSSGNPISYEVLSGPAEVEGNEITFTGGSGKVIVAARHEGDDVYCAAISQPISIRVFDPARPNETMFLGGTFNNWKLAPMALEENLWTLKSVFVSQGNHELKFANTPDWSGDDWGMANGLTGTAALSTGGSPNISFSVKEAGFYNITFNDVTLEYAIIYSDSWHLNKALFVAGTFSNWQTMPMTKEDNGWKIENVEIEAGIHELKFVNTPDWSGDDWGDANGLSGTARLTTGGDPNISFNIESSSTFTISFNDISLAYSITDSHVLTVINESSVGEKDGLRIYPNPTNNGVNIKVTESYKEIEIFNVMGARVIRASVNDQLIYLDTSSFPEGWYTIRVFDKDNRQIMKKMIIKR